MKYLDENIMLTFSNLPVTTKDQAYTYGIYRNNVRVFVGNVFKMTSQTSIRINITQILESLRYQNNAITVPVQSIDTSIRNGVNDLVYGTLSINGTTYTSNTEQVAMVYRYPHYTPSLVQCPFRNPSYIYVDIHNLQQGVNNTSRQTVLLPRLPLVDTAEFGFGCLYQQFNVAGGGEILGTGILSGSIPLNASNNVNLKFDSLSKYMKNYVMLPDNIDVLNDQKYGVFIPGRTTGSGKWVNPQTIELDDTTKQPFYIQVQNQQGVTLQRSIDLFSLTDGRHDFSFTMNGSDVFYQVMIGNATDNVIYDTSAGMRDMLRDANGRTFTLYTEFDKNNTEFKIQYIKIIMDLKNGRNVAGLNLGSITPLCTFDVDCIADYYLEWIDRYGSYQCQPFWGKVSYSESITRTEIKNYTGERRNMHASITPKFAINSGFITKDSIYPIYESIYVSPYLTLYDVKSNKAYNVMLTDKSYEEKKYKNEKQLINLQLNLEVNKDQNILY